MEYINDIFSNPESDNIDLPKKETPAKEGKRWLFGLKWYQAFGIWVVLIVSIPVIFILCLKLKEKNHDRRRLKNKIKYFRPTITEAWWGKRTSWTMRDKPLTDEELNAL